MVSAGPATTSYGRPKENRETALTVVFEGDSFAALILTFVQGLARIGRDIGLARAPPQPRPPEERTMKDVCRGAWTRDREKTARPAAHGRGPTASSAGGPSNENRVRGALRRAQTALGQSGGRHGPRHPLAQARPADQIRGRYQAVARPSRRARRNGLHRLAGPGPPRTPRWV